MPDRISRMLAAIIRRRVWVLVLFGLLVPAAALEALRIPSDGSIDRLIVPSDPDYVATREFHALFPEPQIVLLAFTSPDPWSPEALARLDRATAAIGKIPHVSTFSILDSLRRARPAATPAELARLARGTTFFARQGLVGTDFLTLIANLDVHSPEERDAALGAIDGVLATAGAPVRRVGGPLVSAWIEHAAAAASAHAFPLFGILLVIVALVLFRSVRALLAILIALGAAVALAVAAGGLLGFSFTIVSVLVPLTVLVTTLATLVYLHARYVDHPPGIPLGEHQLAALRNKFKPVTASTIAAAMGFAALAVSKIRPIREMGVWTAIGLVIAWVVAFTLFPALQLALRTPTGAAVQPKHHLYERWAHALPRFTFRHRWSLVGGALALCAAGAAFLFGDPGRGKRRGARCRLAVDPRIRTRTSTRTCAGSAITSRRSTSPTCGSTCRRRPRPIPSCCVR